MSKILWVIVGTLVGVVVLLQSCSAGTKADDLFYCTDWDCAEFISRGKTLLKYVGRTDRHLSFKQNEDIKILSKPVDDKGQDWVGMVQRRVGLVPKTMVREDQVVGKRLSTYKFPLNVLPVWKDDFPLTADEQPVDKDQEEEEDEGGLEEEDTSAENAVQNASGAAAKPPTAPVIDEQATVLPEEVKNQESVTVLPSEAVDHVVPELSEATVTTSDNLGAEKELKQEAIEPTKSSTLDQTVPTTTEVVVEPSEIVDLKDPQDSQDSSVADEVKKSEKVQQEKSHKEKKVHKEPGVQSPPAEPAPPANVTTETEVSSADKTNAEDENASMPEVIPQEEVQVPPVVDEQAPVLPEEVKNEESATVLPLEAVDPKVPGVQSPPEEVAQPEDLTTTEIPIADKPNENAENEGSSMPEVIPQEEVQVPPVVDEQATVLPDEVQNQESVTVLPSEAVDHEEPGVQSPLAEVALPADVTTETEVPSADKTNENAGDDDEEEDRDIGSEDYTSAGDELAALLGEPKSSDDPEGISATTTAPPVETTEASVEEQPEEVPTSPVIDEAFNTTPVPYYGEQESYVSTDSVDESLASTTPTPEIVSMPEMIPQEEVQVPPAAPDINHSHHQHDHSHEHDHGDHHHHHHNHDHARDEKTDDSSSFILIVKHLSSTLLSFLPEHLQDTIIDVDDALVFTGIIALTLVSICVPYFLIEGFFAVRPLKKKVVELNKSLWKVTTAYENQQEEFEMYKKKALAYDEDKSRIEQLEYELGLLKTLEGKHKNEVRKLNMELKTNRQLAEDTESLYSGLKVKLREAAEEGDKWKKTAATMKEALKRLSGESHEAQSEAASAVVDLELVRQSNETLTMKVEVLEREVGEMKAKLSLEIERRRKVEDEREELGKSKTTLEEEYADLKKICHQYESTVDDLTTQITQQENELGALKETLGEDSPLVDIAEVKAKLMNAEQELASLQSRVESTTLENTSLSRNLKESTASLSTIQSERDEALNKLQVLEQWFKEKEEELRKAVERYEAEKNIRGKDKDDLVRMIEDKGDESRELLQRLESCKEEFEELKTQHKNEIRALEAKSHESWLSLCQAERKAQDARKEAEVLRQTLTALTKKEGDENGEVPSYPLLAQELIPPPLDEIPSYFGLGEGFMPPPPLPLDEGRGPHRPAPLGRLSPNYSDLDDTMLSPIRRGGGGRRPDDGDYSDGDSTGSEEDDDSPRHRRSPRGGWVDVQHDRDLRDRDHRDRDRGREERDRRHPRNQGGGGGGGPLTSSPIPQGFNL